MLLTLEERAAEAGESSLSICLSKPLMRLSKLPLLMQALLYHTGSLSSSSPPPPPSLPPSSCSLSCAPSFPPLPPSRLWEMH